MFVCICSLTNVYISNVCSCTTIYSVLCSLCSDTYICFSCPCPWPWPQRFGLGQIFKAKILADYNVHHELTSTRVNYISRSTFLTYLPWSPMAVRDGTVPASFPTGMALALALALALSVLALLTSLVRWLEVEGEPQGPRAPQLATPNRRQWLLQLTDVENSRCTYHSDVGRQPLGDWGSCLPKNLQSIPPKCNKQHLTQLSFDGMHSNVTNHESLSSNQQHSYLQVELLKQLDSL